MPTQPISDLPPQRFFSLRWRLVLVLALLTVFISAFLAWISYQHLLGQYQAARKTVRETAIYQINGLLGHQHQHLKRIAAVAPALAATHDIPTPREMGTFRQHWNETWSALQFDIGLEEAWLFDATAQPLAHWSSDNAVLDLSEQWQAALQKSIREETPLSFIACAPVCRMVALAPTLSHQKVSGVLAVGASLADTVLAFRTISSADIILLADMPANGRQSASQPWVKWGVRVEAASTPDSSLAVLSHAARLHDPRTIPATGQLVDQGGKTWQLLPLALRQENRIPGVHLLMVEDVTRGLAEVRATAWRGVLMVLFGSALTLALLYALLAQPLGRMLRTVNALPLLGLGAFAQFRSTVATRGHIKWHDEVDVLNNAAISLSHRLQGLEQDVSERTHALQRSLGQVLREKAFAASLLDHAQAVIIVSNSDGNILTVNRYGTTLMGLTENELRNQPLADSVPLHGAGAEAHEQLQQVLASTLNEFRHESELTGADGNPHTVSWVHTRLQGSAGEEGLLLSMGVDITERIQNESKLAYLADHDPLTGCFNRRRFQAELEHMQETAKRHSLQGALLYLDLDHFKNINDTRGHQAGDTLLLRVVGELHKVLRNVDILGRMGGDEFAIATLDSSRAGALGVAQRINAQLGNIGLEDLGVNQRTSASIGIAYFSNEDISVPELMTQADIAMYQAKQRQRGSWHVFSQSENVREQLLDSMTWEKRIEHGMAEDKFELYLQPVMGLADNTVQHYEALIRLRLDDGELALPELFMGVAELSGLIRGLDNWIMQKTLRLLASLPEQYQQTVFAINLSGANIGNTTLLNALRQTILVSHIDPRRIIFEITETAAIADFATAQKFIHAVKDLGCAFSVDDFGSGFASFYYLKHLPVDYIKIDGSFIHNLTEKPDDQIFVRAMVELARGYGKKIVAEHVEDAATLELLRTFGVDYVQGYHVGQPAPFSRFFDQAARGIG